jgi:hypothetical protein
MTSTGGDSERAMRERFQWNVFPYLSFLRDIGLFQEDEDGDDIPYSGQNTKRRRSEATTIQAAKQSLIDADNLYPLFLDGCMCISTRDFHMQSSSPSANTGDCSGSKTYHGPYLLPYIDLLNHSPRGSPERVTTLCRDNDGSFVMVAERDIVEGEEIRHSYNSVTAVTYIPISPSSCPLTILQRSPIVPVVNSRKGVYLRSMARQRRGRC